MTAPVLQIARSLPTSTVRSCELRFRQLSLTEIRLLLVALAALLCVSVCAPISWQHQGLDDRAMQSAMLAAGGMPLVQVPSELCAGPPELNRFEQAKLRILLQN